MSYSNICLEFGSGDKRTATMQRVWQQMSIYLFRLVVVVWV